MSLPQPQKVPRSGRRKKKAATTRPAQHNGNNALSSQRPQRKRTRRQPRPPQTMLRPRLRIPARPRLSVPIRSPLALQTRWNHALRNLELREKWNPVEKGIPDFLSPGSINLSWTLYQTHLLDTLNRMTVGTLLHPHPPLSLRVLLLQGVATNNADQLVRPPAPLQTKTGRRNPSRTSCSRRPATRAWRPSSTTPA